MMQVLRSLACVCALLLSCAVVSAQTRPDLSGTWEWQGAEGVSRDGVKGPVHVLDVSGGAFNCGKTCTIAQSPQAITISRPAPDRSMRDQDVVLSFVGTSNAVQAQWDGDKLILAKSFSVITTRQTIVRQGNKLMVTSIVVAPGSDPSPVVQTYIKK